MLQRQKKACQLHRVWSVSERVLSLKPRLACACVHLGAALAEAGQPAAYHPQGQLQGGSGRSAVRLANQCISLCSEAPTGQPDDVLIP